MIVLLWLCLWLVPLIFGTGILAFFYRKQSLYKITVAESYVLGLLVCIGVGQAAHVLGLFGGLSLAKTGILFGASVVVAAVVMLVVAIVFLWKQRERFFRVTKQERTILPFVFLLLFLLQLLFIYCRKPVVTPGDITLETVQSFLAQDGIYKVMPLTGQVSETGMPLRYVILCLPTLYAVLSQVFGMDAELLVYHVIPVVVLVAAYASYYYLSGVLFGEKETKKRYLFLILVAFLLLFMNRGVSAPGYSALYSGYLGTSIRNLVLVPYTFAATLEKRWWKAVLCVLAEACIVWSFWGMGVCAAILVGMLIVTLVDEKCPKVHKIMQIFRKKEDEA